MAKVSIYNEGPETVIIAKRKASGVTEVFWPQILLYQGQSIVLEVSEVVSIFISAIDIEEDVVAELPIQRGDIGPKLVQSPPSNTDQYVWSGSRLTIKRAV